MGLLRNLLAPITNAHTAARLTSIEERLAEIELGWAETLDKLSRWAKRQSKRERDEANRALTDPHPEPLGASLSHDPQQRKHELRRKLAALRAGNREERQA